MLQKQGENLADVIYGKFIKAFKYVPSLKDFHDLECNKKKVVEMNQEK